MISNSLLIMWLWSLYNWFIVETFFILLNFMLYKYLSNKNIVYLLFMFLYSIIIFFSKKIVRSILRMFGFLIKKYIVKIMDVISVMFSEFLYGIILSNNIFKSLLHQEEVLAGS